MANVQFANPVADFYGAANQGINRQLMQQRLAAALYAAHQRAAQDRARSSAGQVLMQLAAPPTAQPTTPGAPSQPAPNPAGPQPAAQGAPGPFRPLPSGAPPSGAPSIAPPPQQGAPAAAPSAPAGGGQLNLGDMIQSLKRNGVPDDQVLDVLDQLAPIMSAQDKQQLASLKQQLAAQKAGTEAYKAELQARRDADNQRYRKERLKQMQQRNDIEKRRLEARLGGTGKIKKWNVDADGNVIGGWDSGGKYHTVQGAPGGLANPKKGANFARDTSMLQRELNSLQANMSPTPAQAQRIQQLEGEIQRRNQQAVSGGGAQPAPGGGQLPAQARAQLKENVNTTFGNGQVWTLRNGQPTRVR